MDHQWLQILVNVKVIEGVGLSGHNHYRLIHVISNSWPARSSCIINHACIPSHAPTKMCWNCSKFVYSSKRCIFYKLDLLSCKLVGIAVAAWKKALISVPNARLCYQYHIKECTKHNCISTRIFKQKGSLKSCSRNRYTKGFIRLT